MADRYRPGIPYRRPANATPIDERSARLLATLLSRSRRTAETPVDPRAAMAISSGGAPIPAPTSPQYVSRPDLRIRGGADPAQQTRQYMTPPPQASPPMAPVDPRAQLTAAEVETPVPIAPPRGWLEANDNDITRWTSLSNAGKLRQYEIYQNIAYAQAGATRTPYNTTGVPILGPALDRAKEQTLAEAPYIPAAEDAPPAGVPLIGQPAQEVVDETYQRLAGQQPEPIVLTDDQWRNALAVWRQVNGQRRADGLAPIDPQGNEIAADQWALMDEAARDAVWTQLAGAEPAQQEFIDGGWGHGLPEWATDNPVTGVVGTALRQIDRPAGEVRSEMGSVAYYMAKNGGKKPPDDWNDLTSWMGSLANVTGPVTDLLGTEIGPGGVDWAGSESVVALTMVEYLEEHPELYPELAEVYERSKALGASDDEAGQAVWSWFYSQQGFLTRLGAEGLYDPLNLISVGGFTGRKGWQQIAREVADSGNPRLTTGQVVRGTISDVVSAPQRTLDTAGQAVATGASRVADLVPGVKWMRAKGPQATRQDMLNQVDDAGRTVERTFQYGSDQDERAFMQARSDAADVKRAADEKRWTSTRARAHAQEQRRARAEADRAARQAESARIRAEQAQTRADETARRQAEQEAARAEADRLAAEQRAANAQARAAAAERAKTAARQSAQDQQIDELQNWYTLRSARGAKPADTATMQRRLDTIAARYGMDPAERDLIETVIRGSDTTVAPRVPVQATMDDVPPIADDIAPVADDVVDVAPVTSADPVLPTRADIEPYVERSPLLREVAQRGRTEPEAAARFWARTEDDIAESAARDDALRPSSGVRETPQRVLEAVRHRTRLEVAYRDEFGEMPTATYTMRRTTKGAPSSEAGAIERAVFGDETESAEAFDMLLNYANRGGKVVDHGIIDELSTLREQVTRTPARMTAPEGRPLTALADDAVDAAPAPQAAVTTTGRFAPDDATVRQVEDAYWRDYGADGPQTPRDPAMPYDPTNPESVVEHAIHGTADTMRDGALVKGTARQARALLHSFTRSDPGPLAQRLRQVANDASEQARRLYGERSLTPTGRVRQRRPKGSAGIISDPKDEAGRMFDTTEQAATYLFGPLRRRAERRIGMSDPGDMPADWVERRDALGAVTDEVAPVDLKSWTGRARAQGQITRRDWENLNTRADIVITRAAKGTPAERRSMTYIEQFEENLAPLIAKRRKAAGIDALIARARTGAVVTDEQFDAAMRQVRDGIDADLAAAIKKTDADFRTALDPTAGLEAPAARRQDRVTSSLGSGLRKTQNFQRANIMFSVVAGPRGYAQDMSDGFRRAFQFGELGATNQVWKIQRRLMKWADENGVDPEVAMGIDSLVKTGRRLPQEYTSGATARLQLESGQTIWTEGLRKFNPLKLAAMPTMKKLRTTGDSAWRIAVFDNIYQKGLVRSRAAFLRRADQFASRAGDPSLVGDLRALGPLFSADDVRMTLRGRGMTDDTLARSWAEELDTRWAEARKKVEDVYFSYKKTNADEALSHIFMFHYFMTRYAGQQAGFMMTHPGFANAYANWWEQKAELQSEIMPDWMANWVQWAGDNGVYYAADFDDFMFGFMGYLSTGEGFFNETRFDEIMRQTNLFPNPLLTAAASAFGFSNRPTDVTGTGRLRTFVTGLVNRARNEDADWMPESIKNDGITEDWWRTTEARIINTLSGIADEYGPSFLEGTQLRDDIDAKRENVERIMLAQAEEAWGPRYRVGEDGRSEVLWTGEQVAEYSAAETALDDGDYTNPLVETALDTWSEVGWQAETIKNVSPWQATARYGPADEDAAQTEAFYEGDESVENAATAEATSYRNLNSDEAREVAAANDQYQNIGGEDGAFLVRGFNRIAYATDLEPGMYSYIGGRMVTSDQLLAMDTDERVAIAEQWLKDQHRGRVIENAPQVYAQVKSEQEAVKAANPRFADYKGYQSWALDDPATALSLLESVEGSEFQAAAERARESFADRGLDVEAEMLTWVGSEEAYAAAMGYVYKGDSAGPAVFTAQFIPPWRDEAGSERTRRQDTEAASPTGEAVDEGLDFETMTADRARQLIRTDSISPDGLELLADNGVITEPMLIEWVNDGTLLDEDVYQMAAQVNLSATDLRYLVEDGYITSQDVLALIFNANDALIAKVREANRRRKYARENAPRNENGDRVYRTPSLVEEWLMPSETAPGQPAGLTFGQ